MRIWLQSHGAVTQMSAVIRMEIDSEAPIRGEIQEAGAQWSDCLQRIAQSADLKAYQSLFSHFAPLIKAFACRVPSLQEPETFAEDLVQETMLKVWTRAGTFDPTLASPSTWIFTIARNMRIDLLRKQARHAVNTVAIHMEDDEGELELEDIWFEDDSGDVFNLLVQERNRQQIHDSLQSLPAEQADILRRVYLEDKSHAEVAGELDLPLGTVKSRVRLALNKLRLLIDR